MNRREFLEKSSVAAAGATLVSAFPAIAQSRNPNDKIIMGIIGCGGMGLQNMGSFLKQPDVEFAAVCDVDSTHMDKAADLLAKNGRKAPKRFKDFRQLLEQKEIDAVLIATPDHWHAIPFIAACEAGKDIYVEKPISHSFVEAKTMLAAALHHKRVVQVGTWQRSVKHFQDAIDYVRSGKLGAIPVCRAWFVNALDGWLKPIGHEKPSAPPASLDWDFWLGPAPRREYASNRSHFNWRWFWDYGGGLMTDWGVHMIDIVLLAMQQSDPISVHAVGGNFALDDDRDTPDTMQVIYRFPKWVMNWEVRFNNGRGLDGGRGHGAEFIGSHGTFIVDREDYQFFPEKTAAPEPPAPVKAERTHWRNFLDCVKSRQKPRSDIESMAKTTMVCHLGNIALRTGKALYWDAEKQDVKNRDDVRSCPSYERPYRAPWKLPHYRA